MKLSKTVSYAVQVTLQLAEQKNDTPVPCSRLAEQGKLPERFLTQILGNLATHGVLESTRGAEGGYMLIRSPDDISLLEMIEAIDGPVKANLPSASGLPAASKSKLQDALRSVTTTSRLQLESIKMSQLMSPTAVASVD